MSLEINVYYKEQDPPKHTQVTTRDVILSWDVLKKSINVPSGKKLSSLMFSYQDDENDRIVGTTELEWNTFCQLLNPNEILIVDIYPIFELNSNDEKIEIANNNFMKMKLDVNKNETQTSSCCSSINDERKSEINYTKSRCCSNGINRGNKSGDSSYETSNYERPMPDPIIDDGAIPEKIVNPTLSDFKYSGESLRAVALPLGPIGGGCIAVAGDGGLRQWQISNKVHHTAHVPDSFFAIRIKSTGEDKSCVLQSDALYNSKGFKPAPYITDHVVPQGSIDLLKAVPGVSEVTITAKYPVVEVDYNVSESVDVHLETWSPKIPLNSKDSGIPVVVFDYLVTNKTKNPIEVSLLGSLQNIAGWNGQDTITNEVYCNGYGGNINSLYTSGSLYAIDMSNPTLPANHPFNGHVAIGAITESEDKISTMLQYYGVKSLWQAFTTTGLPGQGRVGSSMPGATYNGAVCNSKTIPAGSQATFTFTLGWHFPNRYRDWNFGVTIPNTNIFVGNYYAKLWHNMQEVLEYTKSNLPGLRVSTYDFRDSMFGSSLPWQLIDSAAGRVSVLNSPTCMWQADNYFYTFEGCSPSSGCCPLNCTHVWNYEMALAVLYPDLERSMREIDLLYEITPHGVVPSRTTCPLELRRQWVSWTNFTTDPTSNAICVDGQIGTVLKTYRELLNGASLKWFSQVWPSIKLIMDHWLNVLDENKEGMIYGPQPSTYDVPLYGYNTNIGCMYLCGLRAAEEMARLQNDVEFATVCANRFALGSKNLDTKCFTNGKWFTHYTDPNHMTNVLTTCTFVGALYGQWWAHHLGLGYLLPKEHIRSHLKYTYDRNYIESFTPDIKQAPRKFCDERDNGWIMALWDTSEIPQDPLRYSQEASWSGIIYPFAALLLHEGLIDQGLKVLEVTRSLYDGTRRSPWNEIECGDHYARPMSAFSLFAVASGQVWRFRRDGSVMLSFNPVFKTPTFSTLFILGTSWGRYVQTNSHVKLEVLYGSLGLCSLKFPTTDRGFLNSKGEIGENVSVHVNKNMPMMENVRGVKNIPFTYEEALGIVFENPLKIENGHVITIEW